MDYSFIVIEQLDAVGMHHWSHRKLNKNETLKLVREPDNPVDVNAIALYQHDGAEKLAYLGWSDAKRMCMLIENPMVLNRHNLLAIVTGKWEIVLYEQGPRQTCNVALKVLRSNANVVLQYVKSIGLCHAYIA